MGAPKAKKHYRYRSAVTGRYVSAAFAAIPRAQILPAGLRHRAAEDNPLPLGYGSTNSQPWTVRHMLGLLDVPPGARVLDVGSGSGWTTALLAHLTGPGGLEGLCQINSSTL